MMVYHPFLSDLISYRCFFGFLCEMNIIFCLITNENQQNAQMLHIFSICSTYMSLLDHHTVHTLVHRTFQTSVHNFLTLILITNIPHDVWIVDNIFMNSYTLDECTYHCITYFVTAHPDDGQTWPEHIGAKNWENIYHLCILLVFISNYTTVHSVECIKIIVCHSHSQVLVIFKYWAVND
jgi:hypothetical protein